jgi:hypothetical protein
LRASDKPNVEVVFVRKLPLIALAGALSAALAGGAIAAKPQTHVMDYPLPDGSVAHIEYVGNVAPKVTVAPVATDDDSGTLIPLPDFAAFHRMIERMQRQSQELARQAQEMARQAPAAGRMPYIASFGSQPAGVSSTSVVSASTGAGTCTRTTEVVSQGPGKPPKVTSSVSGNCPPEPAAPAKPSPTALDRT